MPPATVCALGDLAGLKVVEPLQCDARMTLPRMILVLCVLLAAACSRGRVGVGGAPPSPSPSPSPSPLPPGPGVGIDPKPPGCEQMDIIFVIDDSGSMREEQDNLALNLPEFASVIDQYVTLSGQDLDYRIAITSTGRDVKYKVSTPFGDSPRDEHGMNGAFQEECGMTRRWLEDGDANLSTTFACAAQLGTTGPGAEMPLLALDWSTTKRVADGTNAGFLRAEALLGVVILTDQDDCSREDDNFTISGWSSTCYDPADANIIPLSSYFNALDTLKGGRNRWAAAVIAGAGPGQCTSSFGSAAEATRLKDFVNQASNGSVFSSVCAGDLSTGLKQALAVFDEACRKLPPIR